MGRAPCCEKVGLKKGRWTQEEDDILSKYIETNGEGSWRNLPKNAGLLRCGKSCRLRWINYLRNDLKRGNISSQEEDIIIKLHASLGNKWSLIASQLKGRTDNEIKNYWNSNLSRKIGTFRRPYGEPLPAMILNNLVNTPAKKKGGRTSRAAMKKNKSNYTDIDKMGKFISPSDANVKENDDTDIEDTCNIVPLPSTPTLEKETLPTAIMSSMDHGGDDEKTKKGNIIVPSFSHPSSVVQERVLGNSEQLSVNKFVRDNYGMINDTTGTSPLYGPNVPRDDHHEGLEHALMSFHESYGQDQINSTMGGEQGEINMSWELDGFIHQKEQDQENQENDEMLSWLWQNDNSNGYQEEMTQNSEKQDAFVAWLLS